MKKCVLLIPLRYNDGSEVSPDVITRILNGFYELFGGYSVAGTVKGAYRMKDGSRANDDSLEIWVVVDPNRIEDVRRRASEICKELLQESIYLEVLESDVEFVEPSLFEE